MIVLKDLQLLRGGKELLKEANATIYPGSKAGLVGANGCGKSSLFALIRGELHQDLGDFTMPSQWQIAWVKQETPSMETSALDYCIDGDSQYREFERRLKIAEQQDDGHEIAEMHAAIDNINGYSIAARAGELLHGLGFSDAQLSLPVSSFSGGWRMRLNLAQALLCRSDLLLLDEPTNHLDLDTVLWLEKWLQSYPGTLILISHDRDFLDNVVDQIIHVEQQTTFSYSGNYSAFEKLRSEKLALQQSMFEKQQKERAHMQSFVDRFRYKASKAKQAQSRLKALEKLEQIGPAHVDSQFSFKFFQPDQLPTPLIQMEKLSAGYGDIEILKSIKLNLVPGSRIGLLGRNGAGKSTLIKLLAGELEQQSGKLVRAGDLTIGYFAQHQLDSLRKQDTALEHMVRLAPDKTEQELRNYLGSFGFTGDMATAVIAPFSGGEKARLALAILTWQRPNLLLLDEPTNHLDLEMRLALTMSLQNFTGAMVIVSHDRHLLRATTDDFYLVDNKQVEPFNGDLDDYHQWLSEQQKEQRNADKLAIASEKPTQPTTNKKINRQDQKRKQAEFRASIQPLKKQFDKVDKQMEKQQQQLASIEEQLADVSLYQAENKSKLAPLLQQQGELKSSLEELEMDWLELQEQIEEKQAAFDKEMSNEA
ncbi:ABC transporter ATP-binding protein [Psychrobium sp. 1_MG-2023]|uniref:ABC transporter ATP-binding protein n=1 Tax=Psychrobium sp. 1_MG-2023 TaxID=3062624 RepID=UPI000C32391A|nr:ABC transporter ATP-binding protein [Psychrobium sp. 1_MG-2023]MDP2560815.1 ABC transporter ATP-binding protein [Psychrobium sp. 1_MG-2023]PKF56690.1 ABC transporter ATP-binding protein [Alteromonadales bacterium alter-6D02]